MRVDIKQALRLCLVVAVFLFFNSKISAQAIGSFSLGDLVDSAQHHLPLLQKKQSLINGAKAGITDARHTYLPKVVVGNEISIASANDLTGSYVPVSGIYRTTSGAIRGENNYKPQTGDITSVYAEYELVNFGLRGAKVDNAIAYADLQQADFNKELYVLKLRVGKIYFNVLKYMYQLRIDEQNIQRYQSINEIILALTESGIKAGVDSSLAKAELSKIKVSYNQREGAIKQLQQQLSFLTGIPVANINIDTLRKDAEVASEKLFSSMADTVSNPLLDYYHKQKSLYKSEETLVKKSFLPRITLAGGGWGRGSSIQYNDNYKSLGTGFGLQRFNYAAGIALTYDLVNIVHRKDKLAVTRFQSEGAGYDLELQRQSLANDNAIATEAIKTAEKNLVELPIQLQAATDAFDQKVAQYKAGIINLIDLTNASFVLYATQLNYADTLNDWYIANLDKAASTGNLDLFIQSIKR